MNELLFSFHGFKTLDRSDFNHGRGRWWLLAIFAVIFLNVSPLCVALWIGNPTLIFSPVRFAIIQSLVIGMAVAFFINLKDYGWKLRRSNVIFMGIVAFWYGTLVLLVNAVLSACITFKVLAPTMQGFDLWFDSARYDVVMNFHKGYLANLVLLGCSAFFLFYSRVIDKAGLEQNNHYGSARWATAKDFKAWDAYNPELGPMLGIDVLGQTLYCPLVNKLTLSPAGGGKTTSSSIPVLLTHKGPVFVFDIKGELWATTARYRSDVLKRQVIVIDPFNVTRGKDFRAGKPEHLLTEHHINPFDFIPKDQLARDRMINAFAASLVINEGGHINHFDENAKILIRGYVDYLMQQEKSMRTLPTLYQLMSESVELAENTFAEMAELTGRAKAAANQIARVGADERGSILSTSYRQIDWMGDSNIQALLSNSNFDLTDFLNGNMDIYVVLPEDQVKEHSRLFRMIMCLLMNLLVQANPSDLPKEKILFLMEEVAQLGASPDIEQCIEVLRARGVVVWTVFQVLKQIEMFAKPDLFKAVPILQIFTNNDKDTMEWVQALGGDKTVLTKTLSTNSGDSKNSHQAFSGSKSKGEGESVHETGVKLIQLNDISVLPENEQFVFLKGKHPIKCKKARYFEHEFYKGKFDENPLENRA